MSITPNEITVLGAMRVRNESRWIAMAIESMLPLCVHITILDDHSTDPTPDICRDFGADRVTVIPSPFDDLHEARDKDYLSAAVLEHVPARHLSGDINSPYFLLMQDGDEVLDPGSVEFIRCELSTTLRHCYALRILYMWNTPDLVRMDRIYSRFTRPSIYRLFSRAHRFMNTGRSGNLHCSSAPWDLLHNAPMLPGGRLLHYGYMLPEDRKRKYEWYSTIEPMKYMEDYYRHVIQNDPWGPPGDAVLKHAGPIEIKSLSSIPLL